MRFFILLIRCFNLSAFSMTHCPHGRRFPSFGCSGCQRLFHQSYYAGIAYQALSIFKQHVPADLRTITNQDIDAYKTPLWAKEIVVHQSRSESALIGAMTNLARTVPPGSKIVPYPAPASGSWHRAFDPNTGIHLLMVEEGYLFRFIVAGI